MDDKDQDQAATDTGISAAGSTLGGAAAGAVAGTALGVPVVGTVIGALSGAAIGATRKRARTPTKAKSAAAPKKKLLNDEAIDEGESEAGHPQSYQEDGRQKAEAESPSHLNCTPERN